MSQSVQGPSFGSPALTRLVRSEAEQFIKNEKSNLCDAPLNPDRFESVDVTPRFERGVQYRAFDINGELLLRQRAVTEKDAPESWYDLGPMPFAVPETSGD